MRILIAITKMHVYVWDCMEDSGLQFQNLTWLHMEYQSNDQLYKEFRPPNGGSNYEEVVEFDPIKHHNHFCPWVNGNVAAAGCSSSSGSGSSAGAQALCGWQLTLDALDAFQSLAQVPIQTMESESAASMHKDDHLTPGRKLLARNSFS